MGNKIIACLWLFFGVITWLLELIVLFFKSLIESRLNYSYFVEYFKHEIESPRRFTLKLTKEIFKEKWDE